MLVFFVGILFGIFSVYIDIFLIVVWHFERIRIYHAFWSGANNTRFFRRRVKRTQSVFNIFFFFLNEREREIEKNIVLFWLNIHKKEHIMVRIHVINERRNETRNKTQKILHILIYVYILYIYIRSKYKSKTSQLKTIILRRFDSRR